MTDPGAQLGTPRVGVVQGRSARRVGRSPQLGPNLLLAGIGRAGSTSLFWYLSQHPDICPSSVKEPRFFLSLSEADADATGRLPPLDGYLRLFGRCTSERFRMEGTPHYFHGGRRLIAGIREVLPDPRIVLMLRDPVARVWSVYRAAMSIMQIPTDLPFDRYVERCVQLYRDDALRTPENRAFWSIRGAIYADFLPAWLDAFTDDRLRILFFEDLIRDPAEVVSASCRWLGLPDAPVAGFTFSVENRTRAFRNKLVHRVALAANSQRLLRDRRRIKPPLRAAYQALNTRAAAERMPANERARLEALFREPNERLAALLTARGLDRFPPWLARVADGGERVQE